MKDVSRMLPKPRFNVWTCERCKKDTVTVEAVDGVTPFMLGCQVTKGCGGMAQSHFYRVPQDGSLTPTHEWYLPSVEELLTFSPATIQHCLQGGLMIRSLSTKPASTHDAGGGEGKNG